ncbi:MAG TPA: SUMF1/EgtB/PvdO family nonheme iron enzyme [Polyangiaceae bacterium]|jgi:formylglycine-generating enzyme required for sulfatase activity
MNIGATEKRARAAAVALSLVCTLVAARAEPTEPAKPPPSEPLKSADANAPPDMKFIPAGAFTMGADKGGEEDEHPAHSVTLDAYWLDTTEVTNEAYDECVSAKVCRPHDPNSSLVNRFGGDEAFRARRQPISSISWEDATGFCKWKGKRLPTEAEWEKAARGTDARRFPWGGETPDADRAVFAAGHTAEVGTHPKGAGPYGNLDMAGNVWEWVADIYDPYAYRRPTADKGIPGSCDQVMAAQDELRRKGLQGFTGKNPIPIECERGLRGGAFNYDGPGLRSCNRVHHPQRFRLIMSGFRCAKDG